MTVPLPPPRQALPAGLLHDLRTPLNQIIGYSELLAEQAQEEGQDGLVPDLHKIRRAGGRLLALINDNFQSFPSPAAAEPDAAPLPAPPGPATAPPPAAVPAQTADDTGAARQPEAGAARGLLLVVDDDEMNRDVLGQRLKRLGHDVVMAANGSEALAAVRRQVFDLVLLDIMMPEMDGYEVLRRLKADEALRPIPVIMISALDQMDSVVRCIEMGAEDYLPKPFDPTLLKARLGASLERKRAHDREVRLFEQLQQNYRRLQELEQLRDDLTHMIIHDLRTPLTSVIAGMQTLGVAGDLNEVQREMMGIAVAGGETLLGMINDLLDVEKMESGAMPLDYAALSAGGLVDAAIAQVEALAESSRLTLIRRIADDLPPLPGDENKLRRTLVNLLGNAIKFTPPGGSVTVEARRTESGQSVVFSVSDTGEGIPPEAFGRIFEKFGQVTSRRGGRTLSTGLGLTFCKLTVEAHGGHIGVESVPGRGSAFRFTIPLPPRSE